jgi:hypothetical protein
MLERDQAARNLVPGLTVDDERHEDLADAMTLELNRDAEAGSCLGEGSTVTSTVDRMGPSMPRAPHVRGGSIWVISEVTDRSAAPMCRVVKQRVPTAGGPDGSGRSRWPSTTPCCIQRSAWDRSHASQ